MSARLDRFTARLLGAGLVIAACDPTGGSRPGLDWAFTAVAAGAAWWAGPMVDTRPVQTSLRWYRIAARRRTTVLPVAAVVIAALTTPPGWLAACTAALLVAYLLVTDLWTRGVTAPRGSRPVAPALAAAAATAVVFLAARIPVAGTSWGRLPAALALTAAMACLGLALVRRRTAR
ncbi:hypothetical protein V2S66_17605 [Streptomyces sp. V4-01]|uniref:Uncharacterized protein n=1 Tax=Actinacidiphila polyblastidii TaxID=3110430 RepID=A0ABU7PDL6_9ACTN|nr:hypothetical protein [Streptomyces sp. V4-01]